MVQPKERLLELCNKELEVDWQVLFNEVDTEELYVPQQIHQLLLATLFKADYHCGKVHPKYCSQLTQYCEAIGDSLSEGKEVKIPKLAILHCIVTLEDVNRQLNRPSSPNPLVS